MRHQPQYGCLQKHLDHWSLRSIRQLQLERVSGSIIPFIAVTPAFVALIFSLLCPHPLNPQSMDHTDSCSIREPTCPLTEAMYYTPFVQASQEIGTAVAAPATAVQPTAEAPRLQRRVDYLGTQDSEELSDEAEHLNDR